MRTKVQNKLSAGGFAKQFAKHISIEWGAARELEERVLCGVFDSVIWGLGAACGTLLGVNLECLLASWMR